MVQEMGRLLVPLAACCSTHIPHTLMHTAGQGRGLGFSGHLGQEVGSGVGPVDSWQKSSKT